MEAREDGLVTSAAVRRTWSLSAQFGSGSWRRARVDSVERVVSEERVGSEERAERADLVERVDSEEGAAKGGEAARGVDEVVVVSDERQGECVHHTPTKRHTYNTIK